METTNNATESANDNSERSVGTDSRLHFTKTIEEIYEGVHDGPILGYGVSGSVKQITHRTTNVPYALKTLDLTRVKTKAQNQQLQDEIDIMCELDHPNVVSLEEVYETPSRICLVQELCSGGELFDRLEDQPFYRYSEDQCVKIVRQIATAVAYLHSKGIVHRDLKLENFLFESKTEGSRLKIIDFGLSKHFTFDESEHDTVGTPYTVAPEVIRGNYDAKCDVWGVGVIAYMLLCGDPPFGGCGGPEEPYEIRDNILAGRLNFGPDPIWDSVSESAKDFIRLLLESDQSRRPTSVECLNLPWLKHPPDPNDNEENNNGSKNNTIDHHTIEAKKEVQNEKKEVQNDKDGKNNERCTKAVTQHKQSERKCRKNERSEKKKRGIFKWIRRQKLS